MVRQEWRLVSFLHWPVPADQLTPMVPPPLSIDTIDGMAWVTASPFSTTCQLLGLVAAPGPARFPETNVRTYVRGPDGRDGLYFLSLDVTNRANAALGRALGLPYHLSDMQVDASLDDSHHDTVVHYAGRRRRGTDRAAYDFTVGVDRSFKTATPDLDVFLTGRWSAYAPWHGVLYRCDVEHQPWPLQPARLLEWGEALRPLHGAGTRPVVVHFAAGVSARLGWPRPIRGPGWHRPSSAPPAIMQDVGTR
jgi:uncharacterized protein YqjF (DUF2071 family)